MIWLTNVFRLKSLSCHSAFPTVSELEKSLSQIAYSTRNKQLFSPCRWKPSVIAVTRCIATAVCSYFGLCAVWKKCFASRSRRLTISLHPLRIISHLWSEMICCVIRIAPTGERLDFTSYFVGFISRNSCRGRGVQFGPCSQYEDWSYFSLAYILNNSIKAKVVVM